MISTQSSASKIADLRADPVKFAIDVLQFDGVGNPQLTEDQLNLLEDLRDNNPRRIAVKGGQGTFKTTTECIIALWRACQPDPGLVIVTAPTLNQLKDVWMAECRKIVDGAIPQFREIVTISGNRSVMCIGSKNQGIRLKSSMKPENFRGYCGPNITFIIDEASGVGPDIFSAIRSSAAAPGTLIVAMGSPNTRDCEFFKCFEDAAHTPHWIQRTWRHGDAMDSDMYRIRVLGEFPEEVKK